MSSPPKQQPELSLDEWVKIAQPGEQFVYTQTTYLTNTYTSRKVGVQAWKLAIIGEVYLVQRRVPYSVPSMFDYIAIKASKPPVRRIVAHDYGDPIELGPRRRPVPVPVNTPVTVNTQVTEQV